MTICFLYSLSIQSSIDSDNNSTCSDPRNILRQSGQSIVEYTDSFRYRRMWDCLIITFFQQDSTFIGKQQNKETISYLIVNGRK